MKEIRFVVEGEPFGKQRPRHNGKVTYTPQETHDHEELVRWAYRSACRGFRLRARTVMMSECLRLALMVGLYAPVSAPSHGSMLCACGIQSTVSSRA